MRKPPVMGRLFLLLEVCEWRRIFVFLEPVASARRRGESEALERVEDQCPRGVHVLGSRMFTVGVLVAGYLVRNASDFREFLLARFLESEVLG